MKILARCQHCHKQRMWEKGSDGVVRPALTADEHDVVGHHSYVCSVSTAGCQPREGVGESYGSRMVRELADSINTRHQGNRPRHGKISADMARSLEVFGRKKRQT